MTERWLLAKLLILWAGRVQGGKVYKLAEDIVSTCVDDRMHGVLSDVLRITGINKHHPVPAFGCSLGLDHEFGLIERIISKLHSHRVSIFDHLRCKAYLDKFGNITVEEERQIHVTMLQRREQELRQHFPSLTEVRLFLLPEVTPERIEPTVVRLESSGILVPV